MTEVVLVRHAQPDWEPDGRAVDQPALTCVGREQARRTAAALAAERFDHVYVSPLRRAVETAEPIAEALGHGGAGGRLARGAPPPEDGGQDRGGGAGVLRRGARSRPGAAVGGNAGWRVLSALLRASEQRNRGSADRDPRDAGSAQLRSPDLARTWRRGARADRRTRGNERSHPLAPPRDRACVVGLDALLECLDRHQPGAGRSRWQTVTSGRSSSFNRIQHLRWKSRWVRRADQPRSSPESQSL